MSDRDRASERGNYPEEEYEELIDIPPLISVPAYFLLHLFLLSIQAIQT